MQWNSSPTNKILTQRDFDFMKIIGAGTFGKVFLAKLNCTNKYFAIKRMNKQLLKESRQLDNINSEINILKETHPCPLIVKYVNSIETNTDIFLVMEYINGGELFYYIKHYGRFEINFVLFFASEILMALKFLHEKNIIYRDLKPENILINGDGHIKLADFGFATRMEDNLYLICGTPEYMAPEKLLGNGDTKETDYWSLGCLIYEMVCGNPPYYNKNTDEIYRKILSEPVAFPPDVTGPVRDLMFRLLRKEREHRLGYRGVEEIMRHPFFGGIDWEDVENLRLEPPFLPELYQFNVGMGNQCEQGSKKNEYKPMHGYRRIYEISKIKRRK